MILLQTSPLGLILVCQAYLFIRSEVVSKRIVNTQYIDILIKVINGINILNVVVPLAI